MQADEWVRISAGTTPYMYDQREALSLLQRVRWSNTLYCPRCGSSDVRAVETDRVVEAFSCRACKYNFTTLADSYFHASRIPLFEHLRFLAAVQLEPGSSAGRLARFFNWSTTTSSRQLTKLPPADPVVFVRSLDDYRPFESFSTVERYFEQPGVRLMPEQLELRINQLFEKSGRVLKRSSKTRREVTNRPVTLLPRHADIAEWSPPTSIPFLLDVTMARDLVDTLLWREGQQYCPRCSSNDVVAVNGYVYRKMYRCKACRNLFNPITRTVFQRTKLPLNKIFQFFALYSALGSDLTVPEVCFAIGCTVKTAMQWLKRGEDLGATHTFAIMDKSLFINQRVTGGEGDTNASFLKLCEMKGVVVDAASFETFVIAMTEV